jgi:hypothetical protein
LNSLGNDRSGPHHCSRGRSYRAGPPLICKLGEVGSESCKPPFHQLEHLLSQLGCLAFLRKAADHLPPDSNRPLLLQNTAAGCSRRVSYPPRRSGCLGHWRNGEKLRSLDSDAARLDRLAKISIPREWTGGRRSTSSSKDWIGCDRAWTKSQRPTSAKPTGDERQRPHHRAAVDGLAGRGAALRSSALGGELAGRKVDGRR